MKETFLQVASFGVESGWRQERAQSDRSSKKGGFKGQVVGF
jgi:hypothetical protein